MKLALAVLFRFCSKSLNLNTAIVMDAPFVLQAFFNDGVQIIMGSFERAPQDKQYIFRTHHAVLLTCLGLLLLLHHFLNLRGRRIRIIDGN